MKNQKTKKSNKRIFYRSIFILGVLLLFFVFRINSLPFRPGSVHSTSKELVHVNIYTQHFWIPRNYFVFPYTKQNAEEQSFGITAFYPDMNGATKETIAEYTARPSFNNSIRISLSARGNKKPEKSFYESYTRDINDKKYFNLKYNGKKYNLHYFFNNPVKSKTFDYDIFIDDIKKPNLLIHCTSASLPEYKTTVDTINASCDQTFQYKGIWFTLVYARKYQPEWQIINRKVKSLFDQFSKYPQSQQN